MSGSLLGAMMIAGTVVSPATTGTATHDWQPCADPPEIQCATLEVLVDWAHPDGQKTCIRLA